MVTSYEPNSDASIALAIRGYNTFSLSTINRVLYQKGFLVFEVPRKDDYYLFRAGKRRFGSNKYNPILLKIICLRLSRNSNKSR